MAARPLISAAALAAASPAAAQQLGGGNAPDISLVRVFLALFICLIIAFLAILLLRQRHGRPFPSWFGRQAPRARISVLETRRIGPAADLSLIQCDDDEYLLLVTAGGPAVLRHRPLSPSKDS